MTSDGADTPVYFRLLGAFAVLDADGNDISPKGRKAQAVIAMLCTGRDGKRTRTWLQNHLWSDRAQPQAAGSLRSCLHEIRTALGDHAGCITADRTKVEIDLNAVTIDLIEMSSSQWLDAVSAGTEFMEGCDIIDAEFVDWLAEQRAHWARKAALPLAENLPAEARAEIRQPPLEKGRPDWDLSLCVLPLENRSGNPQNAFVGSGLSDDLTNSLQRLRWLPILRPPVMPDQPLTDTTRTQSLVENLGARYFVNGSVTQQSNAVVARFQLNDAEDCRVLWSDSYQLDSFLAEGAMASVYNEVVGSIERSVAQSYQRIVMTSEDRGENFQDQIWRGRWHLARLTREDSDKAVQYFNRALELQPNSSEALLQMAFWHLWHTWVSRDGDDGLTQAEDFARRAMELDPDDGRAFAVLGIADAWRRNHDSAIACLEQALELNPNLAIAHHQLGSAFIHNDKPEDAIGPLSLAMRYSPRDQLDFAFQTEMAVALARTGQYDEAYVRATRALMMKPRYWYGHLVRMLVADRLGDGDRLAEARRAYEAANLQLDARIINWLPFSSDDWPNQLRRVLN